MLREVNRRRSRLAIGPNTPQASGTLWVICYGRHRRPAAPLWATCLGRHHRPVARSERRVMATRRPGKLVVAVFMGWATPDEISQFKSASYDKASKTWIHECAQASRPKKLRLFFVGPYLRWLTLCFSAQGN